MHRIKPQMLVRIALLAAISIILGKFLAFNIGDWFRFSFENLPLLLCGYLFGVPSGILCAVVADLVGCLVRGYTVNPIITLGAAALGAAAGCFGGAAKLNDHINYGVGIETVIKNCRKIFFIIKQITIIRCA